jgi:uncharacterized coiled-coil protein SlyX
MQARFIVLGAFLLLCVAVNTYLLALVNSRVGDVRDQVEAMARLDLTFQKKAFGEFNDVQAEVNAALDKLQVRLDKMAEIIKALNASADTRLTYYNKQINLIQDEIKYIREESEKKPGGH